ncbi:pyridoxal phosphate-dependent decarboxylase family protein [Candidatus Solirubrobacter pratensis]|uniref:pyridoxal phosphate-dependent decarboxylase family protein n=1 Tax=Candidatus Solirubrobacter pratensis TaxID=1298857 RepID=UPI00041B0911|nr:pyridoxal-dependent decarboxylase [Candidatus Solirubrobacter pratensis]
MILDADLLARASEHAVAFLEGLPERHAGAVADPEALRIALSAEGVDAATVIDDLVAAVEPGLVASPGPRYFGFVTGGVLPAALAADWLTAAWDQNAGLYATSPAAAVAEEVAAGWLLDVLGLPAGAGVGMVTGAQMANFTCLAVARDEVLRRAGWDVARDGLNGAPRIDVVVGEEAHTTIFRALRMLGLGEPRRVPVDGQGAIDARPLARVDGPAIVCAQAGNVNSGAFDPFGAIADACGENVWLHVDGAFGLWAAASPARRGLVRDAERADSWAVDAHKWLNVPYDSGLAIVADREAHARTFALTAAYLIASGRREPASLVPESSRRARGFAVYAALRALGRDGLGELVDRCCEHAAHMAALLAHGGLEIRNEVVLNQVVVDLPEDRIAAIQDEGTLWASGTVWRGRPSLRISVSGWPTTSEDIERAAEAILAA